MEIIKALKYKNVLIKQTPELASQFESLFQLQRLFSTSFPFGFILFSLPLIPETFPVAHKNLLALLNPSCPFAFISTFSASSQRPDANTQLSPSLAIDGPKLRICSLPDPSIIVHKSSLVPFISSVNSRVCISVQPQIVVAFC